MNISSFESISLITVFIASVTGSLHCAAMCGGLVGFVSSAENRFFSQVSYHGGRLASYSLLGLAAGFLGQSLNLAGAAVGVRGAAPIIAGVLLLFWGIKGLFFRSAVADGVGAFSFAPYKGLSALLQRLFGDVNQRWPYRALLLGMLSGLFPCGWLYAFVAIAAGSSTPVSGMLVMVVFWSGTVPILVVVGGLARVVSNQLSRYAPQVVSLLFIAVGIYSISTHIKIKPFSHLNNRSIESEYSNECH